MKPKTLLFTLFASAAIITNAQPAIQWQKSLGGTYDDWAYSVQQTTDGGYIVAGISGSTDGDVTGNHGSADCWIVKLNSAGAIQWQKSLGGSGYDEATCIQQTSDGGYIVAGRSDSTDGDVSGNHGGDDYWIVKLNSAGTIQWQKSLGGTGNDYAYSIQQTTDGGYIVAGGSNSTDGDVTGNHGYYDYWVVKLNSAGAIQWQKSFGGTSDDDATSIRQTTDGGYIVAGYSYSNDGDVTGNHGDYDYWILKLNSTGAIEWKKCLGGQYIDMTRSIQQTADNGYIVAGWSSLTGGAYDYLIVKLNSAGAIQWQKRLGGSYFDNANAIRQTSDGMYIIAGVSGSTDGDVTGNHSNGNGDYWIVKLNNTGTIQWQKCMGGTDLDEPRSVQQTSDGGYIVAGLSGSTDEDVTGNHGQDDYWVVKLSPYVGIDESLAYEHSVILYPNPATNQLTIHSPSFHANEAIAISVMNVLGEIIKEENVRWSNDININIINLSEGIYFLQLKTENGRVVKKFVKE